MDYIHYNPVKHNLTSDPASYAWSSFLTYRAKDSYPSGWGAAQPPDGIENLNFE